MPDPSLYLAFVAATALLMLVPGPNVALIVANSVAYGSRFGLVTVAGTCSAIVIQVTLTDIGLDAALTTLGHWFEWLRWIGAGYLLLLGIRAWRAPAADLAATRAQPRSVRHILAQAFLVSLTNPKTLLFYGAFMPQFIDADRPLLPQVAVLSVTFLALAASIDSVWALAAGRARPLLARHGRLRNRLTGGLLMGAGLGLALARRR